jgi:D-alanine-D-alanine ligase
MRVAFLYNEAVEDPAGMAEDDVPARSPVVAALQRNGHDVVPIACTLDLAQVRAQVGRAAPEVAFNRVESLGGSDAMMAAIPLLLESMQVPCTGCPADALTATASKLAVKKRLVEAGLPTPAWLAGNLESPTSDREFSQLASNPESQNNHPRYILKSVLEHASFEIDDRAVVGPCHTAEIERLVRDRAEAAGRPFFAERFIEGREFNLSLLGDGPDVLPPAEIDFSAFPTGKPRIVGSGAKWDERSFEFHHTPRRFNFPASDQPLLDRLEELAVACWRLFGLCGYARVDFRCDPAGRPWILEINTNPCIMPQAGFAAALERASIGYDGGIQRILEAAMPSTLETCSR